MAFLDFTTSWHQTSRPGQGQKIVPWVTTQFGYDLGIKLDNLQVDPGLSKENRRVARLPSTQQRLFRHMTSSAICPGEAVPTTHPASGTFGCHLS